MSEEAEVQIPEVEQVKTAEASTPEKVEDTANAETVTDTEEKPEKTFTQAELDEIVQKRISKLERKAERQRIEAETRQKVLAEVQQSKPVEINPADYKTWEEYQDAVLAAKVETTLSKREQEAQQKQVQQRQQQEAERVRTREQEIYAEGDKKYGDFEGIVSDLGGHLKSQNLSLSTPCVAAIMEADNAVEIIYHLNEHPEEAERIAKLSEYGQAKEIGKLEDKLQKPKKLSNTPEPVKPIGGGATLQKTLETATGAEYAALRKKQGARWA